MRNRRVHCTPTPGCGFTHIDLEVLGSESSGDLACAHGTYSLADADGNPVQDGKWMNVSKKIDGEWLIVADIWNTNEPDATPAE